jgi:hypothetical protein
MGTRQRPVCYEPHPVSRERKAELRALGFNIVDAKFAPPAEKKSATRTQRKQPTQGVQ